MRYINKIISPKSFERWKAANKDKTYYDLGEDAPAIKSELKQQLIEEQKYICCYCEREIEIDNSHIEHFLPQSGKTQKHQLNYNNLLISCNDKNSCGQKKDNTNSPNLINPTEIDTLSHFTFQVGGSILGCDDKGIITVDTLNLNSEILKHQRKILIDCCIDCIKGGYDDYIEEYLSVTHGRYNSFYGSIMFSVGNFLYV